MTHLSSMAEHTAEKSPEGAPVPPEDWCEHHYEWADDAGRCRHPGCTVTGPQVYVIPPGATAPSKRGEQQ